MIINVNINSDSLSVCVILYFYEANRVIYSEIDSQYLDIVVVYSKNNYRMIFDIVMRCDTPFYQLL